MRAKTDEGVIPSKQEPHFGVVFGKAPILNLLKSKADSEMFTPEWGWGVLVGHGPWVPSFHLPPGAREGELEAGFEGGRSPFTAAMGFATPFPGGLRGRGICSVGRSLGDPRGPEDLARPSPPALSWLGGSLTSAPGEPPPVPGRRGRGGAAHCLKAPRGGARAQSLRCGRHARRREDRRGDPGLVGALQTTHLGRMGFTSEAQQVLNKFLLIES